MPRVATAVGVVVTMTLCIWLNITRYPVVWEMVTVAPRASQSGASEEPDESSDSLSASESTTAGQSATTSASQVASESDSGGATTFGGQSTFVAPIPSDTSDVIASPSTYTAADAAETSSGAYDYNDYEYKASDPVDSGPAHDPAAHGTDKPTTYGADEPITYGTEQPSAYRAEEPSSKYGSPAKYGTRPDESTSGKRLVPVTGPRGHGAPARLPDPQGRRSGQAPAAEAGVSDEVRRLPAVDPADTADSDHPVPRSPDSPIPVYPTTAM